MAPTPPWLTFLTLSLTSSMILTALAMVTDLCISGTSRCDFASLPLQQPDLNILLEFKRSITSDPYNITGSWQANFTCSGNWVGVCTSRVGKVTEISLYNSRLSGTVPASLANLTGLLYLDISGNRFTGGVPAPSSSGTFPSLLYLDASKNSFTGSIPTSIATIPDLQYLDFSNNKLTGSIPSTLPISTKLTYLRLTSNSLTGIIPTDVSSWQSLEDLSFGKNKLCGTVPPSLGNLPLLASIDLSNNYLSGNVTPALASALCSYTPDVFDKNCITPPATDKTGCLTVLMATTACVSPCSSPPPGEVNLALKKPTGKSSTFSGTDPSWVVDGSTGNGSFSSNSCFRTKTNVNSFWFVDLGSVRYVSIVKLYNRLDCCSDRLNGVQVYVGNSNSSLNYVSSNANCTDPQFVYSPTNQGFPLVVKCGLIGRYVWVALFGQKTTLALCEVVVIG